MIERAWRCRQRLYQRWQRMAGRGKPQQKIVVACARARQLRLGDRDRGTIPPQQLNPTTNTLGLELSRTGDAARIKLW